MLLTLFSELSSVYRRILFQNPKTSHVFLFQWVKAIFKNGLMYFDIFCLSAGSNLGET